MTVLDRLRAWLFGDADAESSGAESSVASSSEESGEQQLDPDNVTQVRSSREDDPVSKLQDIQEQTNDGKESDV